MDIHKQSTKIYVYELINYNLNIKQFNTAI